MADKRAVVIGSGFGGLSMAIRLQLQGLQTTLLEGRDKLGGRAYVFEDQGFSFDAGPTVITAPHCLEELYELSGRDLHKSVDLIPVKPLYRLYWEDGLQFDYTDSLPETLAQIEKLNPRDVQGYQAFSKYSKQVFDAGYTKLVHVPFLDWGSMIKAAPELIRLKGYRSVYEMVSRYISDDHLRRAFTFHSLLVGGNPFSASAIYTLIHHLERKWGVYFARGGTAALVRALGNYFVDLGGKIALNQRVTEIVTQGGRVTGVKTASGDDFPAEWVVSNADVTRTYCDLLKKESAVDSTRRRLLKSHHSMSLFLIYFGTKRQYPNMAHHSVVFGKEYRQLLQNIFVKGKVSDDFSLYVHTPTRTDPSVAPAGCENFYALSPVPHLGKCDPNWSEFKEEYGERILSYLESRLLPDLRKEIIVKRMFTPEDFRDQLQAHHGNAFSLEPRLTQSAYFRVHNRDPKIKGLYFVGAGTHPGAGIPGVVNSAKATAQVIEEDRKKFLSVYIDNRNLAQYSQEKIQKGSKSFSLASMLLPVNLRTRAHYLYSWCRYCDDQIDNITEPTLQLKRLQELREMTAAAFRGDKDLLPEFDALSQTVRTCNIPVFYADELLVGMEMDIALTTYETAQELELYCYRVAGTVGLMMAYAMGVSTEKAMRNAMHLGMAMQMTNIARDVVEDAKNGRVYLPLKWLEELRVPVERVADVKYRAEIAQLSKRLVRYARHFYRSGNAGIKYLPVGAAFAVAMASRVYSRIGVEVVSRQERAWDTRTVVSPLYKALALVQAAGDLLMTVPHRLFHPFRESAKIRKIWRLE